MTDIRLAPITDAEFTLYLNVAVPAYADLHVAAGSWPAEGARERSANDFAELLPDGPATPDHYVFSAWDRNRRVGMLWYAEQSWGAERIAYLYDIRIDAASRGRGYGDAVMQAMERHAAANGLAGVRLHVHGHNEIARSLYRKHGYVETNITMAKRLSGTARNP